MLTLMHTILMLIEVYEIVKWGGKISAGYFLHNTSRMLSLPSAMKSVLYYAHYVMEYIRRKSCR
jgi:hypothetical protein